ncbi:hypothetical protein [Neisseria iguanae]|nr:hypothetical protein [Neisseria iguanae]
MLMATSQNLEALALGFSEGILITPAELYDIEANEACNCILRLLQRVSKF